MTRSTKRSASAAAAATEAAAAETSAPAAGPSSAPAAAPTKATGTKKAKTSKAAQAAAAAAQAQQAQGPPQPPQPAPLDPLEIEKRIQTTRQQLRDTEQKIFNLETTYFENANIQGNALRGYEGLLSTTSAKKIPFKHEDRIFSGSSVSSGIPFIT